jgi:inositol transport system substrate-binding protein
MVFARRSGLLGAMFAVALATSCSPAADDDQQVFVSFHNLAEPFFVEMRRELEADADRLGVEVTVVDGQSNAAKQSADLETALVGGAGGIILAPTDIKALAPAVDRVIVEGTPIITVDRRIEGTRSAVPHVGADNVAGGRLLAEWVISRFPNGADVVLLTGQPGSSSAIDRTRGFKTRLGEAGGTYRILVEQSANWQRDLGLTITQNILTSLGERRPAAIVAENDDMALGAREALRSAGIRGVEVAGFDASPEVLGLIQRGEIAATVEQSPRRQITTALQQVVIRMRGGAAMAGGSIAPTLITRDNVSSAERFDEVGR